MLSELERLLTLRLRAFSKQDIPIFAALEDTPDEWIRSSIGTYLPRSIEQRTAEMEKKLSEASSASSFTWVVELKVPNRSSNLVEAHSQLGPAVGFLSFYFDQRAS